MVDNVAITAGTGTTVATDDIGGVHYQIFKNAFGALDTATLVTSATPLPAYKPNRSATGSLTALNSAVTLLLDGDGDVAMDIAVTALVGTIIFEMRMTGGTWFPVNATLSSTSGPITTYVNPASGLYVLSSGGRSEVRVRVSAFTSGSAAVIIGSSASSNAIYANQILPTKLFDGTNSVTIKGASTAAVAADPSLVVAIHPTSPLPAGGNVLGALTANQSVNNAQVGGVATATGSGVVGTGVQRVVLATDVPLPAGTAIIGALSANQSVNAAQINGVAPLMGTGISGTGALRVTLATDIALPTGGNTIGAVNIAAAQTLATVTTVSTVTNLSQLGGAAIAMGSGVTGTGVQRVVLATDVALPSAAAPPATYSATVVGLATAVSATDIFTITGSATKTIRVTRILVNGVQTTAAQVNVLIVKRSTANSAGTSTASTAVPYDSTSAAATATVLAYTANPTLGTALGTASASRAFIPGAATASDAQGLVIQSGDFGQQAMTLRGIAQVLAVNLNATTVAGSAINVTIEWTES